MLPRPISQSRYAFGVCAVVSALCVVGVGFLGIAPHPAEEAVEAHSALQPLMGLAILAAAWSWLLIHERARALRSAGRALVALTGAFAAAALIGRAVTNVDTSSGLPGGLAVVEKALQAASPASCVTLLLAALALALTHARSARAQEVRQLTRLLGLALPLFTLALFAYDPAAVAAIRGFGDVSLAETMALVLLMLAVAFDGPASSLRWQIAYIGVAVVAPLAALTVHFASAERELALAHAASRLKAAASLAAERQDAVIEQTRQMLAFIGRSRAVRTSAPSCAAELAEYLPLNPWIRAIFTVGRDGSITCGNRPGITAVTLADRDYVRAGFADERMTVSGVFISRGDGEPRIAVVLPLRSEGRVEQILVAAIDLAAMSDAFDKPAMEGSPAGSLTLVDRKGVLVARPGAAGRVAEMLAEAPFVRRALAGERGPFEAEDLDDERAVFVSQPTLAGQGTLIAAMPRAEVVGPVDERLNRRLLLIAAILAASLALGVAGSEALVLRPLRRLIAYAGRLEAGDLAARPDTSARGEVGALGRALAVSAAAIQDRERRLAATEALFRGFFDHSPDAQAVVAVEPDGCFRIETWNAAAANLSGIPASQAVGRSPRETFGEARGEAIERDLRHTIALGRVSIVEREVTSSAAPGVFEMVQAPQFSADGAVQRIFVSARDISERKRVERLKNEFVSTVSHELRTPLTSIAGSLGLLAGGAAGALGDKARHLVAIAHSNSLRLVRLINDILDIEKIEAGRMNFEVRPLLVREIVEQAISGLRGYADDLGVTVEFAESERGLMVRGDADRLTQVVTNLLGNAIKFSPRGETVTVAAVAEGDITLISVRDRGPGVPESFQPRLFSKFAQADGSDSRRLGGTGLGLAIAREIVERHAGAISCRSAPGAGSEFEVRLPRHAEPEAASPAPASERVFRPTVLVCEDDPLVATILVDQMRDAGFDGLAVGTVRGALNALQTQRIDAALVDLRLPDGDGVGLIRELRSTSRGARMPIVVVSADIAQGRQDERSAGLDVAAWLQKPIDMRRLSGLLRRRLKPYGLRPRVLHVEDDGDLAKVVAAALGSLADVVSVPGLADARRELAGGRFDLAIVDVALADGSGLDLLPELATSQPQGIPALVFSARDMDPAAGAVAKATMTKSRTSLLALVEAVRRLTDDSASSSAPPSIRAGAER